jgi:formylglycine-generating enzyme required for sulfatase activity
MSNPVTSTRSVPVKPRAFAACGRWLALALVAGFTLAAQAQRTATAIATVMNGFVVEITVTDGGSGYLVPPAVTITGGGGSGATAASTITNGAVSRVTVLTTGSGYTSTPSVVIAPTTEPKLAIQMAPLLVVDGEPGSTARVSYAESTTPATWVVITNVVLGADAFTWCDPVASPGQRQYQAVSVPPNPSPNPRTATGTVVVYNGFVIGVTVTNGGEGYFRPPSVTFTGSGSGATATASISNGVVTQVTVNQTGSGYSNASVVFSAPPRVTRLTEYQVPRVTVRQDPPADVVLQSSVALGGTNPWTYRIAFVTSSNGVVWSDLTATQALSRFYRAQPNPAPAMVLIPAGPFVMGDTLDGDTYALPLRTNLISAFYMDRTEVTKTLWDEVRVWALTNGYSFANAGSGKATNHPVHTVNWWDCVKWCNARSEKAGLVPAYYTSGAQTAIYRTGQNNLTNGCVKWTATGYRLPTEAEWEKAARGGASGQRFPWGNTITHSQANYHSSPYFTYDTSPTGGYHPTFATGASPYTSPVGYFAANGYGLYDMAGNIWQWCWDWWGSYSAAPATDPRGPSGVVSDRVLRGGGWGNTAYAARCAYRNYGVPNVASNYFGFRCVRGL